jgi:hypothetical protein
LITARRVVDPHRGARTSIIGTTAGLGRVMATMYSRGTCRLIYKAAPSRSKRPITALAGTWKAEAAWSR